MEASQEESAPDQPLPTRRALEEGEGTVLAESEPLNDLNTSSSGGLRPDKADYKPVTGNPGSEQITAGSLAQTDQSCFTSDQPSHEDVVLLEAEKERFRRDNEAKNMVLDVIYGQMPQKIKKLLDVSVGTGKGDSGLKFSELSTEELKRLTKWLTEHKPFEELKESDLIDFAEDVPLSVEEENDDSIDGTPVFPHSQIQPMQSSPADPQPSKGKKMVQRTKSVLGSGTYGEVRVAKHKGQCYAAKELKLQDSHCIDNLYREAANLALLEHVNIVAFCGIAVYQGDIRHSFLILTELLATSLHRYLMEDPNINLENQVSILFNVLSGLEYMHQEPVIIHGDLKTKNILLSEQGIAKIADLGSSRLAHDDIRRHVCGTPSYMAPEIARREYTEKMDVFAYGHLSLVTLTRWEISMGEFSKPCNNAAGKEISKRRELFSCLEGVAFAVISGFIPLIEHCLCDEPNQRPQLNVLKKNMRDLRLPRELPNVSTDTAVRNEV